ncbi:nickel ABC transporter substrate-binding protein [Methylomusa anaerophila]|uniref:Nickel-binding periplasmic protein n=1 Tax=Methylomusa anaerophila TaxID=1930071 RepID=A0A348AE72_9FIRM|nr:nickel ABC transporter substrate-binding protein [Methylomusa anaerophila]BBB89370.1 nickel-binding periplasmic protein precursor [Methylomusa anaerophila]
MKINRLAEADKYVETAMGQEQKEEVSLIKFMKHNNWSKFLTIIFLIFLILLICGLLAGCGGKSTQTSTQSKILTYSYPKDIGPLNPHQYNPNQMVAQAMVYEPLVQYGADGKIIPWLAESWTISPDGKEYIFKLRKGVKFSDGTEFNAAAVKKNFDAVLANGKRHEWLEFIRQIQETRAVDDLTFTLVLKEVYYPTLQELALIRPLRFLAPSAFTDNGNTAETIKQPVGTGPWVLSEYKQGEMAVFVRNEHYWGPQPKLDKIIFKIISDGESRVMAFEKEELDLIYGYGSISIDAFKQLRDSGKYEAKLSEPLATRAIAVNSNRGPTKELKVRQALQHAVDKEALVKGVFFGIERKADTLFAPNFPYCDLGLKPYEFNLDKARTLLEEAGWKLPPGQEFREKDGQELELELCFESTDAVQKSVSEVLQGDMRKIGVRLKLVNEEKQAYEQRRKNGSFHLIFSNTWGVPYDPHSFVGSMRSPADADYQAQAGLPMKAEIDKTINDVLISTDELRRQDMYRYILGTLHDQAVYLPLTYLTNQAVYHKNVSGVIFLGSQYDIPFANMDKQ